MSDADQTYGKRLLKTLNEGDECEGPDGFMVMEMPLDAWHEAVELATKLAEIERAFRPPSNALRGEGEE